jgi:hypothetical protein
MVGLVVGGLVVGLVVRLVGGLVVGLVVRLVGGLVVDLVGGLVGAAVPRIVGTLDGRLEGLETDDGDFRFTRTTIQVPPAMPATTTTTMVITMTSIPLLIRGVLVAADR